MHSLRTLLAAACIALSHVAPAAEASSDPKEKPRMEIAFVIDTTTSMGGMIAAAKQKIWAIANRLKSAEPTPEIRFALVAYRDRGDSYVTQVHALNDDLDDIYQKLLGLDAGGGGDTPESVNEGLHRAVQDLPWSDDPRVLRVIFLVGDAPPHLDYGDDVPYDVSCRAARQRGILVNTLQCGAMTGTEPVWREIAKLTGGSYAAILQDGGALKITTPFDDEIVRLNLALDATIVPYGTLAERASAARNRTMLTRLSVEGVAERASFLGKTEFGAVMSGKGDLVLEVMSDRFQLSTLDSEKLDPALRRMFAAERNAFILRQVEERRALQEKLVKLVRQRDTAVRETLQAVDGNRAALELSAFEFLEAQAGTKGFRFARAP